MSKKPNPNKPVKAVPAKTVVTVVDEAEVSAMSLICKEYKAVKAKEKELRDILEAKIPAGEARRWGEWVASRYYAPSNRINAELVRIRYPKIVAKVTSTVDSWPLLVDCKPQADIVITPTGTEGLIK